MTETSAIAIIWNTSCKNASFELKTSNQWFFNWYYISFQDMQSFFEFLASVINHDHINGWHLFSDSFEWFLSPNKQWRKMFFPLLSKALWSRIVHQWLWRPGFYLRHKKWYLVPPCLTLSFNRYISRVKWSNPGKGVMPCPTTQCSSYWKGIHRVVLDYSCQHYLFSNLKQKITHCY